MGEADVATPPADARWLADHIAGAQLAVISGAAHIANLESPDVFSERLERFLAATADGTLERAPTCFGIPSDACPPTPDLRSSMPAD